MISLQEIRPLLRLLYHNPIPIHNYFVSFARTCLKRSQKLVFLQKIHTLALPFCPAMRYNREDMALVWRLTLRAGPCPYDPAPSRMWKG